MDRDPFTRHLDEPDFSPSDPKHRELVSLLKEIAALEPPDPGELYWSRFNQRLDEKRHRARAHRAGRHHARWGIWAGAMAAAAAMILLIWAGTRSPVDARSLDDLSDETLATLHDAFYIQEEEPPETVDWGSSEVDVILQAYDPNYESLLLESGGAVQEELQWLKANWNVEG